MLYQPILTSERPYYLELGRMDGFREHHHSELELSFCLEGSYDICIDKTTYRLEAGDLAIIGSMIPHMIPDNSGKHTLALTIEAGPVLLAEYFTPLSKIIFTKPVLHLRGTDGKHCRLAELLEEVAGYKQNYTDFSELMIRGNFYHIFGYILTSLVSDTASEANTKTLRDLAKIEQALELIRTRYAEPLTVEQVAAITGYGKSNFCKIFKQITGETFHSILNTKRLEHACTLLANTSLSIEDVANQVGCADAKSLCRLFKAAYGTTPGTYRKQYK